MDTLPPEPNAELIAARHRIRQEAFGAAWLVVERLRQTTPLMKPNEPVILTHLGSIRADLITRLKDQMHVKDEIAAGAADILIKEASHKATKWMKNTDPVAETNDAAIAARDVFGPTIEKHFNDLAYGRIRQEVFGAIWLIDERLRDAGPSNVIYHPSYHSIAAHSRCLRSGVAAMLHNDAHVPEAQAREVAKQLIDDVVKEAVVRIQKGDFEAHYSDVSSAIIAARHVFGQELDEHFERPTGRGIR